MPVVPAAWEAEAGELLEPGRQRLQLAKIVTPHSSLGNRVRLSQKKDTISDNHISSPAVVFNQTEVAEMT